MTDSNRHVRHTGRAALRNITTIMRCFDCGRQTHTEDGAVGIRKTAAGIVGYSGITSCGRVWICPVCNAKIMAKRAAEIRAALVWAAFKGLHVIFGSLTIRHNTTSRLTDLLDIQRTAWRSVVQSRIWSKSSATATVEHEHDRECPYDCERKSDSVDTGAPGRVGYIRAAEITIGENGWHPHFHPIIFWRGTKKAGERFAAHIVKEWVAAVVAAGGDAIEDGGQQLRIYDGAEVSDELGSYVTKATYDPQRLSLEATWSQGKTSRGRRAAKTSSHWSILAGVAAGLLREVELWEELEEATAGHRMITWSRGLRSFVEVEDLEDEEIASEEVGDATDTVATLPNASWRALMDTPAATAGILDQLELSEDAMAAELDSWGVEWWWLEDVPL